mmetsp:Transcript_15055/g.56735  ORF Transcript_15055/g.56735 Transcript_15055/m.56735 type:complete len:694 (-) Transcript_15055:1024-3105(-)
MLPAHALEPAAVHVRAPGAAQAAARCGRLTPLKPPARGRASAQRQAAAARCKPHRLAQPVRAGPLRRQAAGVGGVPSPRPLRLALGFHSHAAPCELVPGPGDHACVPQRGGSHDGRKGGICADACAWRRGARDDGRRRRVEPNVTGGRPRARSPSSPACSASPPAQCHLQGERANHAELVRPPRRERRARSPRDRPRRRRAGPRGQSRRAPCTAAAASAGAVVAMPSRRAGGALLPRAAVVACLAPPVPSLRLRPVRFALALAALRVLGSHAVRCAVLLVAAWSIHGAGHRVMRLKSCLRGALPGSVGLAASRRQRRGISARRSLAPRAAAAADPDSGAAPANATAARPSAVGACVCCGVTVARSPSTGVSQSGQEQLMARQGHACRCRSTRNRCLGISAHARRHNRHGCSCASPQGPHGPQGDHHRSDAERRCLCQRRQVGPARGHERRIGREPHLEHGRDEGVPVHARRGSHAREHRRGHSDEQVDSEEEDDRDEDEERDGQRLARDAHGVHLAEGQLEERQHGRDHGGELRRLVPDDGVERDAEDAGGGQEQEQVEQDGRVRRGPEHGPEHGPDLRNDHHVRHDAHGPEQHGKGQPAQQAVPPRHEPGKQVHVAERRAPGLQVAERGQNDGPRVGQGRVAGLRHGLVDAVHPPAQGHAVHQHPQERDRQDDVVRVGLADGAHLHHAAAKG